ncbi:MAG TPA: homoserine dehydrogenase [Rhodanobacteraceae bacterium]
MRAEASTAVVLFGTGVVGGAFLKLLDTPAAAAIGLVGVANSRAQQSHTEHLARRDLRRQLNAGQGDVRDNARLIDALVASGARHRVIVDATASAGLAAQHAAWLTEGCHVVTANKAANGGLLAQWRELQAARKQGGTRYGDAATVGAGLPIIDTIRRLRACGDALLTLEGVFSGSLGWLFSSYDGSVPFSQLLRRARELGYSEPDPRMDLSGQDVARKLLILARTAGFALGSDEVVVENLVPEALRDLEPAAFLEQAEVLDEPFAARLAQARERGGVLRYLARLDQRGHARVGLSIVPPGHPAAGLTGTDNQFAITTTRYHAQPLVIQGPGAGADITAQALLGDILLTVQSAC